ncbi:hypothetical protein, partial [Streptomyces sp. NPDC056983]|uniref:hypothetical protein n=1 Tax=Streptomyces sp. NPDC056983 TaxID=3345987 RepID=UPI0036304094
SPPRPNAGCPSGFSAAGDTACDAGRPPVPAEVSRASAQCGARPVVHEPGLDGGPGERAMTAGVAGATRGRLLSLAPSVPLLILTQTARHGGRAACLAKYIVRARERLSINQPPQS